MTLRAAAAALVVTGVAVTTGSRAAGLAQPEYVDLGTLGGKTAVALDVNALGDVVGYSSTKSGDQHAFLWSRGRMVDLGTLGGRTSVANAVSDTGAVVGASLVAGRDVYHAFLWTRRGGMRDLGTLGGSESFANDVNDRGVVVGTSLGRDEAPHAFAWTARSGMVELRGGPYSTANGVGAGRTGPIAGSAGLPFVPGTWRSRTARFAAVGLPAGAGAGQATAIDARGDVAGTIQTTQDLVHPFLRRPGRAAADLGPPVGFVNAEANGLSNARRVVGVAYDDPLGVSAAWLYRPGRGKELFPALRTASAVNDLGEIAATGVVGSSTHGFLLRPSPAEEAASLKAIGLGSRRFRVSFARTIEHALRTPSRACTLLRKLAARAARERTIRAAARPLVAADVRGLRRTLGCPGG